MQDFYECETKHGSIWAERGEVLAASEALAATELVRDLATEFPNAVGLRWEVRVRLRHSANWAYFERRARNVIVVDDLQPQKRNQRFSSQRTDGGCTPIVPDGSPGLGPNA